MIKFRTGKMVNLKRLILSVSIIVTVGILVFPIKTQLAEPVSILVMSPDNRPVVAATIRQTWRHYDWEYKKDHEITKVTGEDGRVHFSAIQISTSFGSRLLTYTLNMLQGGVHAGHGFHTNIYFVSQGKIGQKRVNKNEGDQVYMQES